MFICAHVFQYSETKISGSAASMTATITFALLQIQRNIPQETFI